MLDKPDLSHYKDSIGNRDKGIYPQLPKLPIRLVDQEADRLERDFNNPGWHGWYCGVINKLGLEKVHELESRAKDGDEAGKLFSKLAKEAMGSRVGRRSE